MANVTGTSGSDALTFGSLEVVPAAYRATLHDCELALTPTQVDLLSFLIVNRHRVVTPSELARAGRIDDASVDVVLSGLRRVLGDAFVRNVRNRGWILRPSAFEV